MLRELPKLVYPLRLARSERVLRGRIALARMDRLQPLLATDVGCVEVNLDFGSDDQGYLSIQGKMRTELRLICQRCLGAMPFRVESDIRLNMISSDSQTAKHLKKQISPGFEPLVVMDEGTAMTLSDIVEDELILTLPAVPRHPDDACGIVGRSRIAESTYYDDRNKPFSVLESLMGRQENGVLGKK
uniref:Large ribosomal RNA subunit accumulation protein YceD n=1 Tax=Candidatus Kentrum sp. SD TaxID=2126332 RepID=A0A450YSS8_9GAMM|nr:MAG: uncharacterized protein BECKSD772F_GA0070984_104010 [Candidatus Kentron sp. SD]VFK44573.1 MAG: uncharacterized protein BECKSD772E_GA0070983_104010 [Candidatus Kentron sp. SD]VFK79028.1 MAG: uncharacterized protein BECKSD772D_GA0070982_103310 [Candidatus Kentron sp. SD]